MEALALAHKVYGQSNPGVPLVILHGMLGSKENWHSFSQHMSTVESVDSPRHIITLDLRNHGQSAHSASMSYRAMAEDVLYTMEKMEVECTLIQIGRS